MGMAAQALRDKEELNILKYLNDLVALGLDDQEAIDALRYISTKVDGSDISAVAETLTSLKDRPGTQSWNTTIAAYGDGSMYGRSTDLLLGYMSVVAMMPRPSDPKWCALLAKRLDRLYGGGSADLENYVKKVEAAESKYRDDESAVPSLLMLANLAATAATSRMGKEAVAKGGARLARIAGMAASGSIRQAGVFLQALTANTPGVTGQIVSRGAQSYGRIARGVSGKILRALASPRVLLISAGLEAYNLYASLVGDEEVENMLEQERSTPGDTSIGQEVLDDLDDFLGINQDG